jgi:Leucine-rich repeat (LRR) protein
MLDATTTGCGWLSQVNSPNLQWLHLRGTQVSDVSPLAGLTNLRTLYLRGTKVSAEQVAELQKGLTRCNILGEGTTSDWAAR